VCKNLIKRGGVTLGDETGHTLKSKRGSLRVTRASVARGGTGVRAGASAAGALPLVVGGEGVEGDEAGTCYLHVVYNTQLLIY
jgi:hypothetical protein